MANVTCVYVFDTDPSARKGLMHLLLAAGYDVRAFAHTDEFLDALDSQDADCVVLDAGITDLPVEELQARFNRFGVHPLVIVLTTHNDRETRRKAAKLNAIAFFHKPVDGPALIDAIDWAVRSHRENGSRKQT